MEKGRKIKVIAIIALVVAVIGMSLGFAAFSNILTISSKATVTPDSEAFKIWGSGSSTDINVNSIEGVATNGATAGIASIINEDMPVYTNLSAGFTEPGQSVSYTGYTHNIGEYIVYPRAIEFGNVSGTELKKVCTAVDPKNTTSSLVEEACNSINISVTHGISKYPDVVYTVKKTVMFRETEIFGVEKGEYTFAIITIDYDANGVRADGAFNVQFGDITYLFSSTNK